MIKLKFRYILGIKYESDLVKARQDLGMVTPLTMNSLEKKLINIKGDINNMLEDVTFLILKN